MSGRERLALAGLAIALAACERAPELPAAAPKPQPTAVAAQPTATTLAPPGSPPQLPEPRARTEPLEADGGELGKAYDTLVAAYEAKDLARYGPLLDTKEAIDPQTIEMVLPDMRRVRAIGGVRQGDRATLFLGGADNWTGTYNATRVGDGWVWDAVNPPTGHVTGAWSVYPDCDGRARFPCRVETYPDAKVSGRVRYHLDPAANYLSPSGVLLDGYAVRILDGESRALRHTRVVLASSAFAPHDIARMDGADSADWLDGPALVLDVAPDGKRAKLTFVGIRPAPTFDVTDGLLVDVSAPRRIRGHLEYDAKDIGAFEADFDVATRSECLLDQNHCGNDLDDAVLR